MVNYDELMAYAETHGIDKDKLNRVIDSPAVSTYGPDDDLVSGTINEVVIHVTNH